MALLHLYKAKDDVYSDVCSLEFLWLHIFVPAQDRGKAVQIIKEVIEALPFPAARLSSLDVLADVFSVECCRRGA